MRHRINDLSRSGYGFAVALSIALTSLLASAWADTGQAAPPYYDLSFVIERDGDSLGTPRMLVPTGEPAEIRVASDETGTGYRLTVVARPGESMDGRPTVDVAGEFFVRGQEGEWEPVAQPRIVVEPGRPASMSIGGPGEGTPPALFIEVTAEPVSHQAYEQIRREMQAAYGK